MILEQYETKFLAELERNFSDCLSFRQVSLPISIGVLGLSKCYSLIINEFLGLECAVIEAMFERRYQSKMYIYFINHYTPEKILIFLALVCHLVLEDNLSLFFRRFEITGKFFGNWAIGHLKGDSVTDTISRRAQNSHGREGLSDFYYDAYLKLSREEFDRILQKKQDIEEIKQTEKDREKKMDLFKLLGMSGVAIVLTSMAKYAKDLLRIWVPADGSTQAMLSVGHAFGSVKLYGFCMQKPKPIPNDGTFYTPVYREHLSSDLGEIYDRSQIFMEFFTAFMDTTDLSITSLATVDDGEKIWSTLQKFFLLITQPYDKALNEKGVIWLDFLPSTPYCDNNDHHNLTTKCIDIIIQDGIQVHNENEHIFTELTGKIIE